MYRLLHLSDLHIRDSSNSLVQPILDEAKKTILSEASSENIDVVVFTGDIAFSGKKGEFDLAKSWLEDLCLSPSGLNLSREQVLFVPGNHDVDRSAISVTAEAVQGQLKNATNQAGVSRFYDDTRSRSLLMERFSAYSEFVNAFAGKELDPTRCWSRVFRVKSGGRVRIDGLNSSWLCDGTEKKSLLVGQSQLSQLTQQIKVHPAKAGREIRIVLMHHPLTDLVEFDEDNTRDFLVNNADILLRGHLHKSGASDIRSNLGRLIEIPAGALFDRFEAQNRFNVIDIADDLSEVRITPFFWSHGKWKHDRNLFSTDDGVGRFSLEHHDEEIATATATATGWSIAARSSSDAPDLNQLSQFEFLSRPTSQYLAIRQSQLQTAISILDRSRLLLLRREPGSRYERFIEVLVDELSRTKRIDCKSYWFNCSGVSNGNELQSLIETSTGLTFTQLGSLLREEANCLVVFDDLDHIEEAGESRENTISGTLEALVDFCPSLIVVRISALPPFQTANSILVGALDLGDTRTFLDRASPSITLESVYDYSRVFRATGGVISTLEELIRSLSFGSLDEALAQINEDHLRNDDDDYASALHSVDAILGNNSDDSTRAMSLLSALAILKQGETLAQIKRLDPTRPIWPKHAEILFSFGCLDAMSVPRTVIKKERMRDNASVGEKVLRIPRHVRAAVKNRLDEEQQIDMTRRVASLYFSDDWRNGVVRLRRRLSVGDEILAYQSGNELAILRELLCRAQKYFDTPIIAFHLALSYASQLRTKGFFGEAYEAAKEIIAISADSQSQYSQVDLLHVQLLAAGCARMVGEQSACVTFLEQAIPTLRETKQTGMLTDALVDLSLALQTLGRTSDAKESAKEVLRIASPNSEEHLQAQAILAEYAPTREAAVKSLKRIANKAKGLKHFTVYDNVVLEIVRDSDNSEEKLRLLNSVRSRRDFSYNFIRATIKRVETLILSNRTEDLTDIDLEDLNYSYLVAHSQRMSSMLSWCHRVIWDLLIIRNDIEALERLMAFSSFFWRLNGAVEEELKYSQLLRDHAQRRGGGWFSQVAGYVLRRLEFLSATERTPGN